MSQVLHASCMCTHVIRRLTACLSTICAFFHLPSSSGGRCRAIRIRRYRLRCDRDHSPCSAACEPAAPAPGHIGGSGSGVHDGAALARGSTGCAGASNGTAEWHESTPLTNAASLHLIETGNTTSSHPSIHFPDSMVRTLAFGSTWLSLTLTCTKCPHSSGCRLQFCT